MERKTTRLPKIKCKFSTSFLGQDTKDNICSLCPNREYAAICNGTEDDLKNCPFWYSKIPKLKIY